MFIKKSYFSLLKRLARSGERIVVDNIHTPPRLMVEKSYKKVSFRAVEKLLTARLIHDVGGAYVVSDAGQKFVDNGWSPLPEEKQLSFL